MRPGDVISYTEMCQREGGSLQHGMNFRFRHQHSVLLMSTRPNAPYQDEVRENGSVLIYEGHDQARTAGGPDPKAIDQPYHNPSGSLTRNGRFYNAAKGYQSGERPAERVRVYEKIKAGIWVYAGEFLLVDAWQESDGKRNVFRFRLEVCSADRDSNFPNEIELEHTRLIPSHVKLEVWRRDGGRCRECGATDNLHFDHIIPFSRGGSSLTAENIQLLCARHNYEKRDRIE